MKYAVKAGDILFTSHKPITEEQRRKAVAVLFEWLGSEGIPAQIRNAVNVEVQFPIDDAGAAL